MCGIAGIASLGSRPIAADAIKRMCDSIAHRGPDDAGYVFFRPGGVRLGRDRHGDGGYWCDFADAEFRHFNEHLPVFGGSYYRDEMAANDFTVALGHRRLSIIDLTHHGHQPMASPDRRYWIAYNGEVYNFRELRSRLSDDGHLFRSRSDTEVILRLWDEYGTDALQMLDGMFALSIYDRLENVLTLARDRFGVKPLYYAFAGGDLVFASEIKSLIAGGHVRPQINPAALVEYFTFQNLYGRATLFEQVKLLEPGQFLEFRPGQERIPQPRKYHPGFPEIDPSLTDEETATEMVSEAFASAVERQLVSDVEVGSYLSGGMDSGSIVAVAGRSIPRLVTFTAGFDLTNVNGLEQGFDERKLAEQLSYLFQTEHYDVVLHSGDMPAAMEQISWHMDDPRVGMCHQNWYVAKLASKFVKVCLAGAGGDELFAGYPWRYRWGLDAQSFDEFDEAYYTYWHRILPPDEMPRVFSSELKQYCQATRESFRSVMADAPDYRDDVGCRENMLQRALHFEFKTFLQGFLIVEDRISMAHSLETRVPFLDNQLADLAWRLPPSLKVKTASLQGGQTKQHFESSGGKRILRRAMESFLPREFTQQRKQGFSPPDENWYRGPSMDYINDILRDRRAAERPWFDQRFINQKLDEHFEGRCNHRLLIWSLLSVEWLQRHYTDPAPAARLAKSA